VKTSKLPGLVLLAVLAGSPARGDVFSPGELSRAHEKLEGLQNCTRCHVAGKQLAPDRCLDCHAELKDRVAQGRGFHGRIPSGERACESCHHEHQGRDFALIDWGAPGRKGLDHAKTGFELQGRHRKVDCARCHDPRLVADAGVKAMLEKQPERRTLLGAPQACAACHFDEHRGQVGTDCQRCHSEEAWKPARGFDHARTAYRLDGKHAKVECARCHKPIQAAPPTVPAAMTPPARPLDFARYKPLPFESCLDCHKDPHVGRFGGTCKSCHTTEDWKKVTNLGAQTAFHEKTRYPLRGAHVQARCEACHGPFPGAPVKYREIPFARCTDCHADAHAGQLPRPGAPGVRPAKEAEVTQAQTCDRCHTVEAFVPARFELEDHDRTTYPLQGAHRAVACAACHPKNPRLETRLPAVVKADLERRKRPVRVSLALYDIPRANDCRTCHRDPHGGQLDARVKVQGCGACHGVDSFRRLVFDHGKDSRYPLTGKHQKVACGSCHRPEANGMVRYRPLATACASCHADVHAGQLAVKGQGTDCSRCHETAGWKEPLRFVHKKPFTAFALEGKHEKLACEKCHPSVVIQGAAIRRYKPVPVACEGCHADFHKGAFRGYVP
jgi:hypothetical protein